MPFYCGERSASICIVLDTKNPQRIPAYTPPFFEPAPLICPELLHLATKDYSDGLPSLPTEILSGHFKGILNMFDLRGEGTHPLQQDDIESAQSIFDMVAGQVQSR